MADRGDADIVHPEDQQLVEKLAKLQNMYKQIAGLRTLLPEKLINPTRFALDNPDGYDPEKLATFLQSAAQAGSRDVGRFKRDWHSENVRELWHTVNTNDLPQGGDAWTVDYERLLWNSAGKVDSGKPLAVVSNQSASAQTDIAKIVGDFRSGHPELKVNGSNEGNILPMDVTVAQLDFRIDQDQSFGNVQFTVNPTPGTEASVLRDDIIEAIRGSNGISSLAGLLDMLAAYHDIKTRPCDTCNKLVSNTKLQLPLIRRLKTGTSGKDSQFTALHSDCA